MADKRFYIKLDVGYFNNPKIARLTRPTSLLLHITSITYARQHFTDGVVPVNLLLRQTLGAKPADADALYAEGLWHDLGGGQAMVHDYTEHQDSAAAIDAASMKGKAAAHARWNATSNATGMQDALQENTDSTPSEPGSAQQSSVTGEYNDRRYQSVIAGFNAGVTGISAGQERAGGAPSNATSMPDAMPRRGEERSKEKNVPSPSAMVTAIDADFDTWWTRYPRKIGKGAARKAYRSARKKTTTDRLLSSLLSQIPTWTEPRFIPHPATWLNGERWLDETPTEQVPDHGGAWADTSDPWNQA